MADIIEGFLYIWHKDIKKPTQKKIVAYLKKHGVENVDDILNNILPVIIIGHAEEEDMTKFDTMVS